MTQAKLFDGTILNFPDGTSPEVIARVAKEQTAAKKAAAAPAEQPSVMTDVPASFGSGVVRGAAETAMLPITATRMSGELQDAASYGVVGAMDALANKIFGSERMTDAEQSNLKTAMTGNRDMLDKGQDAVRGFMDDNLYAPKTTPGKYAETVGEFVAPGGMPTRAARALPTVARRVGEYTADAVRGAVIPGVASEAAGQAAEGTQYEAPARLVGALAGNVGASVGRAAGAPENVLRRAAGPVDAIDWERAIQLQNNTRGVALTGPEAIAQAQNGASALPNLQRVVEGSVEGRAATAPFFSARPGQVGTAVDDVLNLISPQSVNPSLLGPRASEAATAAIGDVEAARTAAVAPTYRAADLDTVPVDDVQAIINRIAEQTAADTTGVLGGPLNDLRARLIAEPAQAGQSATRTPVTGPNGQVTRYTHTPAVDPIPARPANDVENLDRTRKYFRDRMDLPQIGADAITKEQNATVTQHLTALDDLMTQHSPKFAAGKQQYADITRDVVEPVALGPVGKVAASKDTAGAGNAILPQNPMTGSGDETIDAVRRLVAQDPGTTTGLIRQNLGDRYAKAATDTQEGANEFVGAKYHKDIAGNQPRRETLDAVLSALPDQAAATSMPELLDVLQATGRRKPIGSATEFNRALNADLGAGSPMGRALNLLKSGGASWLTNAGDAGQRLMLRNSLGNLADLFTDPNSVELIRAAMSKSAPIGIAEALTRTGLQGGPIMDRGNQ